MLWNVHISWKKMALMSIFSLTIIVISVSIMRVNLTNVFTAKNRKAEITLQYFWIDIEVAVFMFFSSVRHPAYRSQ